MRATAPLTAVIEEVYAHTPDVDTWLEGVRRAIDGAFDGQLGTQAFAARLGDRAITIEGIARGGMHAELLAQALSLASPASIDAYYRTGPVSRASDHVDLNDPARAHMMGFGIQQIIVVRGFADTRRACVATLMLKDEKETVSRSARTALVRLSAHLGAAYRLRAASGPDDGEAVLTPRGQLLHAEGPARERASRERLKEAALDIARAKRECARDPAAGLGFWKAMVEGQWTLVERLDADGKRLLIAKRNSPKTSARLALSGRERSVIERAALGAGVRQIAYELGLAESTVSVALTRALSKLGLRTRYQVMELRNAIADDESTRGPD